MLLAFGHNVHLKVSTLAGFLLYPHCSNKYAVVTFLALCV